MLKILAISDLHGKLPDIRKAANDVDLIASMGDFCSAQKIRALEFKHWKHEKKWYEIVGAKKAEQIILEDVESGRKVLAKLNKLEKPVFVIPGNVDYPDPVLFTKLKEYQWNYYLKKFKNVFDVEFALIDIGDYQVIGYGRSSAPEKLGNKTVRRRIVKALASLFRRAKKPVIFLSHNVPYKVLDKVSMKSSPAYGEHSGSDITREMIERFSPAVCICGHMHETQGVARLGKTTVINAGLGMTGQYAVITLNKKKIKVYLRQGLVRNSLASPPRSPPPPFRERWTITRSHRQGGCPIGECRSSISTDISRARRGGERATRRASRWRRQDN